MKRDALLELVRRRAHGKCECCLLPESLSRLPHLMDHVISRQHRGRTTVENLAFCCGFCNRHKGPNIYGRDPQDDQPCRLFNPRTDTWSEHFSRRGAYLFGKTAIGRTTIDVLQMNHSVQIGIRNSVLGEGNELSSNS